MDMILLKNVEKIGKEGAVVRVKPGFARNYLVPHGLALPATPAHLKSAEERQRQAQHKRRRAQQEAEALKARLEAKSLTLKLAVGEGEKAFGSITVHDIVTALAQQGIAVEKHAVQLAEPIKSLGIYEVPVRVQPETTATLKVWVVKA